MRIGVKPGQWGWAFADLEAAWQAAEECGFDVVSCFDHVTAAPAGLPAWDAPTLLCAMANVARRPRLSVDVINSSLRHPFLLAGQLAVAQAASGNRIEVGLGAGSHRFARFDHEALGIPFPPLRERVARLERVCRLLPALWRGELVTDEELGLRRVGLGPLGIQPPPLVVGGTSDAVLTVAARCADGWNAVEPDPERFAELSERLDELCAGVGRDHAIGKGVQLFLRDVELSSARSLAARFEAAGAGTATFVLTEGGPDAVRSLADAVL